MIFIKRKIIYMTIAVLVFLSLSYVMFFKQIPTRIQVFLKPRSVLIGDTIQLTYKITFDENTEIKLPNIESVLNQFDVVDKETFTSKFLRKNVVKKVFFLSIYTPGQYKISSVEIKHKEGGKEEKVLKSKILYLRVKELVDAKKLEEVRVKMVSDLADNRRYGRYEAGSDEDEGREGFVNAPLRYPIKEIEGPRDVLTYKDLFFRGIIILFIAIIGILFIVFVLSLIKTIFRKPEIPLHKIMIKKIKKLGYDRLLEKGEISTFCSALSEYIKEYIAGRFNKILVGKTMDEITNEIEEIKEIEETQRKSLIERMEFYDFVKYAQYSPDVKQLNDYLKEEIKFIQETKPKEEIEEDNR
jgi:hypothetical protein